MPSGSSKRIEFGDWQTPTEFADEVLSILKEKLIQAPATIVEPTCGLGNFLVTAGKIWPDALLFGVDISEDYINQAKERLANRSSQLVVGDFFQFNWKKAFEELPEPLLIVGNPPWVTNAGIGNLIGKNLPTKNNFRQLGGLDAKTGKSNFDISEWMIINILQNLAEKHFIFAFLCKTSVARKVVEYAFRDSWDFQFEFYGFEAKKYFGVNVDACLLVCQKNIEKESTIPIVPVFFDLHSPQPNSRISIINGGLVADLEKFRVSEFIEGKSPVEWRSGIKHDCAAVLEVKKEQEGLVNGLGEPVVVEDTFVFPLLKGSDIANGRPHSEKFLLVPQQAIGENTLYLEQVAPLFWDYLTAHKNEFLKRKSSIYRGKPPFSIFGVGPYTFAPYKIAICGLYKKIYFSFVNPVQGKPVMFDDTVYFLPFWDEKEAHVAYKALSAPEIKTFFEGRIFWDEKRPITKKVLDKLNFRPLMANDSFSQNPYYSVGSMKQIQLL